MIIELEWLNRNYNKEDIEINGVPVEGATDKYNEYLIQRSYFAEVNLNNVANCDFSNERQEELSQMLYRRWM